MKTAAIDIGTNTVLLLVADKQGEMLRVLDEKQEIPRLGKGVDKERNLHPDSQQRVVNVLLRYRDFLQKNWPETVDRVVVTATSAVRDASNRDTFLEEIFLETGWRVRLLSGSEEARVTFRGALSVFHHRRPERSLILDIGGGSTEIARGKRGRLDRAVSLNMGSVRFSERFFTTDPPTPADVEEARNAINQQYKTASAKLLPVQADFRENFEAVGVAGTVTSIAAIERGLTKYTPALLNGLQLNRATIQKFVYEFSEKRSNEIEEKYSTFLKGRGDVILAGVLILDEFLEWCKKDVLTVSTGGIRHGVLL